MLVLIVGTEDWSRTSTSRRTLAPEASASTNSATSAEVYQNNDAIDEQTAVHRRMELMSVKKETRSVNLS